MNKEIKELFKQVKNKREFCINLSKYTGAKQTCVTNKWFYIDGTIPKDLLPEVIKKLKQEIEQEKIKHKNIWSIKNK